LLLTDLLLIPFEMVEASRSGSRYRNICEALMSKRIGISPAKGVKPFVGAVRRSVRRHALLALASCMLCTTATAFAVAGRAQPVAQMDLYRIIDSPKARSKAISIFDRYLRRTRLNARVSGCSSLLSAHLGEVEDVYVGDCRLTDGQRVTLCADTGVGEFGLNLYLSRDYNLKEEDLVAFSKQSCPGG